MAIACINPIDAARVDRQLAERAAMNSPDPVERWKAKERAINSAFAEMSSALIADAEKNAKAFRAIEKKTPKFYEE